MGQQQLDLAWLVGELERLGLALSAVPLSDGSFRVARWRSIRYWENAADAETLWSATVGENRDVHDELARYLMDAPRYPLAQTTLAGAQTPLVPAADPSAAGSNE